ncbi:beta-ketoacyl synthase N-terminal-like domain-containing protein [Xenorhabdus sp. KJ12.1]|uniref:beta-ketoacyl synthase N-terminal-like domain-containing protein n=1 Tax=Xenorhabdus sp. KJ12.1 TaxID=1851571 RepID=UPI000C049EA1|nr:beta-ketoacyl synthase N-terminal-like domain-containing protein [Xenorhabdus sp. KJ12.1]PHM67149.1 putative hybrid polyketide-non-ribosomal peptide synthetase [Xenorhabdus sp. KJ12.1]
MKFRKLTKYEELQLFISNNTLDEQTGVLSYTYELKGFFDKKKLEESLEMVILKDFNSLCFNITKRDKEIGIINCGRPETILNKVISEEAFDNQEPFTPELNGKLFRFTLFSDDYKSSKLRLQFSHLVFDGTCYKPFIENLARVWKKEFNQDAIIDEFPPLALKSVEPIPSELEYWKMVLKGSRLYQPLPFCFKTPKKNGISLTVKKTIQTTSFRAIHKTTREFGVTIFQFVIATMAALISRYSEQQDKGKERVVLSHTVNSRPAGEAYCCYTNIIPLFLNVDIHQPASNLMKEVVRAREQVIPYQNVPTLQLIEMADAKANHGGRLFNVIINCSEGLVPYQLPQLDGIDISWLSKPATSGTSDLVLNYSCDGSNLYLSFDSSSRYMSHETLSALAENFVLISSFIASNPNIRLDELDLSRSLTPAIYGTKKNSLPDINILQKFTLVTQRYADEEAIKDENASLSYSQSSRLVNAVSEAIATLPEFSSINSIGVFLGRSILLPIAYLGAIALECPFVPMDPLLPDERLKYIAEASEANIFIVDQGTKSRAKELFPYAYLVDVNQIIKSGYEFGGNLLTIKNRVRKTDRTAYIMFTSGSTGQPKGVAISYRNLANFLAAMEISPGIRPGERLLALTPISFDISILELLLPLMCGGKIFIVSDDTRISASLLGDAINSNKVDLVQATASSWRILQQSGWSAKQPFTALSGGEQLEKDVAQYLLREAGLLYNMYGPTEATIWASIYQVTDTDNIYLGRPLPNCDFYIIDNNGKSVAPGMKGELVISGSCVGSGYINSATEQVFITLDDGSKAYRTGDIVRYLSFNEISYVGRHDNQHKINGYRIDTSETSHCIKAFIPEATVFTVVRKHPEPNLSSFIWLPPECDFDETETLSWCKQHLPYYMVPRVVRRLKKIPLTPNGKADVKSLSEALFDKLPLIEPRFGASKPAKLFNHTSQNIQRSLQVMIKEKLEVNVSDFDQSLGWLGMNSISFNILSSEIDKIFGIKFLSYEFYQYGSINEIASVIERRISGYSDSTDSTNNVTEINSHTEDTKEQPLAIVGMSVTMPGGHDVERFWQTLIEQKNCISSAPAIRNLEGAYAGFLPDIAGFDARFFSISPLEATRMDPRQRLLLQASWRTLENSGYAPSTLAGSCTGCYIAATGLDYALLQARVGENQTPHSLSGHSLSMLANRLSSHFDWNGPSFVIDTACSGVLTALVKAARDLRMGICDFALVGGINLILDAQINEGLNAGRFMSPDYRCATFDEKANGYVRGEGYGCFLVKRLTDALADGDHIHAVIESVAENHGGKASSLTAPNPDAQYRLLLDAYTPELAQRVSFIETHGTGTKLGDPIEIAALQRAWQHLVNQKKTQPVWLGAVKSNIGHLEPAAGVASIAKIVKAFEQKSLPANLHFEHLNPDIDLDSSSFRVLTKTIEWRASTPLTAGISSFGFGGSNAHVVLSAPSPRPERENSQIKAFLIPISARSEKALSNNISSLASLLEQHHQDYYCSEKMLDLAFTLSCGRDHFEYRQIWLVTNIDDLLENLRSPYQCVKISRNNSMLEEYSSSYSLESSEILSNIKRSYLEGARINWQNLYADCAPRKIPLTTYCFDERPYWFSKSSSENLSIDRYRTKQG